MKKKFALINLSLMCSVLFAILFQSLHSYEHFLGEEISFIYQDSNHKDVHQNDHNHEKCFVCEFTFSSFLASAKPSFSFNFEFVKILYKFPTPESTPYFSGSSFSLRGPPSCIA